MSFCCPRLFAASGRSFSVTPIALSGSGCQKHTMFCTWSSRSFTKTNVFATKMFKIRSWPFLKSSCSDVDPQDGPRAPQERPKSLPRAPQEVPKSLARPSRSPLDGPRAPKSLPRAPQELPKSLPTPSRGPLDGPRAPQDLPKSPPRAFQELPKSLPRPSRGPLQAPRAPTFRVCFGLPTFRV